MTKISNFSVRGVVYKTVAAAAKAIGVSEFAVYYAHNHGSLDRLGTSSSNKAVRQRACIDYKDFRRNA